MLGSPTRDSNATVENWMKIIKIETLGRMKRLHVRKFVRNCHLILKGRLKENGPQKTPQMEQRQMQKGKELSKMSQKKLQNRGTRQKKPSKTILHFSTRHQRRFPRQRRTETPNRKTRRFLLQRKKVDQNQMLNQCQL